MGIQFVKPKFSMIKNAEIPNLCSFEVDQLERGFAITFGNILRRTLLSSIPGIAVYAIKIKGAPHEFTNIPGVRENVVQIISNIKRLVLKLDDESGYDVELDDLTLSVKGNKVVTANDIVCPTEVSIVNKDLVIAHLTDDTSELEIEFLINVSRGYFTFEENKKNLGSNHFGWISIDSSYSPIEKVSFEIVPTKILRNVEYEKLVLNVQTNGSITPSAVVSMASKILIEHLELFVNVENAIKNFEIIAENNFVDEETANVLLEELNLRVRSYNCLRQYDIRTLYDIVKHTEEEIRNIKNLGSVSFEEIKQKVLSRGLKFKESNN